MHQHDRISLQIHFVPASFRSEWPPTNLPWWAAALEVARLGPWGTIFAAQPLLAPLYRNDDSSRVGGKWSDETLGSGPVNIYN